MVSHWLSFPDGIFYLFLSLLSCGLMHDIVKFTYFPFYANFISLPKIAYVFIRNRFGRWLFFFFFVGEEE